MEREKNSPAWAGNESRKRTPNRAAKSISFARGLTIQELTTILQHELLKARTAADRAGQSAAGALVPIPAEIVHDIKHRLTRYYELNGDLPQEDD